MYFFFFFPVGTDASQRRPPLGTAFLLAVLAATYSLAWIRPELYYDLVSRSFVPSRPTWSSALLSIFLHADAPHLLGNALYLAIFGKQFESRLSAAPLYAIFLAGGLAGCWIQAAVTPPHAWNYDLPVVGASGSVAALLGATLVRFHHQRVRVFYLLFAFLGGMTRGGAVYLNTALVCAGWFVYQVAYGLVAWGGGGAAVAYGAHAGGFVVGLALSVLLGFPGDVRREVHKERGRRHFERGEWYAAAGELTTHLGHVPGDADARRMRARCWFLTGQRGEAQAEYVSLLRAFRRQKDLARAAELFVEMGRYGISSNLREPDLLRAAFDLQKAGRLEAATIVYGEYALRFPEGQAADLALVRRAEILWEKLGRLDEARDAYATLVRDFPDSEWAGLATGRLSGMGALAGEPATSPKTPGTSTPRGSSGSRSRT